MKAASSASRVDTVTISPSPVRSHVSFTLNSSQMSRIVRSLGCYAPEQSSDTKGWDKPSRAENSLRFMPSVSIRGLSRSFTEITSCEVIKPQELRKVKEKLAERIFVLDKLARLC